MLNMHSEFEAAAEARMPLGVGICLRSGAAWTAQPRERFAVMYARPRAFRAVDVVGQRRMAAGLTVAAPGQPNASKHPYTTRIAASGGTKGPHPAREPEPA